MGIIFGFINAINSLFAIFEVLMFSIPVLIVVIVLLVLQRKRTNQRAKEIEEKEKSYRFCRNCGKPLNQGASICTNCGVRAGTGNRYCPRCGNKTDEIAVVCVRCGASLAGSSMYDISTKSKLAAGILGLLFGSLGIHNFYLGYTLKAIAQIIITIFCIIFSILPGIVVVSIWGFIEGVMILAGGISKDASGGLLV